MVHFSRFRIDYAQNSRYLALPNACKSRTVFKSPATLPPGKFDTNNAPNYKANTYGFNVIGRPLYYGTAQCLEGDSSGHYMLAGMGTSLAGLWYINITGLKAASQFHMAFDSIYSDGWNYGVNGNSQFFFANRIVNVDDRHNGKVNVVFADGHATAEKKQFFLDCYYPN